MRTGRWIVPVVITLGACATGAGGETVTVPGWYIERSGQSMFKPCDRSETWGLQETAALQERAQQFRLAEDTPVYVVLEGRKHSHEPVLVVSRVQQFGSEVPRRDCPMSGFRTIQ